jgi:hypothetical protein
MAMRAAANQFGYLLGAAVGGLALAVAGFAGLGAALSTMFFLAVLVQLPALDAVQAGIARRVAARSA